MQQPYFHTQQQRPAAPPARRRGLSDWHVIAIVFVGSMIGGLFVWPLIRQHLINDPSNYSSTAGYDQQGVLHHRGRR